jgi:hypothetical protein
MAEKLSVQIALEGGKEIERQLADIGKAGEKAFAQIEKSATEVGGFRNLKPEAVTAQLKSLGVEGTAAVDKIQAAVSKAANWERLVVGVQSAETAFAALGRAIVPIGLVAGAAIAAINKQTIAFAQSITKISTEAIKLGLSFEEFDAARQKLEAFGISAQGISSAFAHVQQNIERMRLERVARDAESVKNGFIGSGAALERLKKQALEFTAVGDAAAKALLSLGYKIPGVSEKDIQKLGLELARLKALVEQVTGQKVEIDIDADAADQMEAFKELLERLPDGAQRTALAFKLLGPAAAEFIQSLRLAEGSLPPAEANALLLTQAMTKLQAAFARFGSTSFAPFVTAEINAVTTMLQTLQAAIDNLSWTTFTNAVMAAGNALNYFTIQGLAAVGVKFVWDLTGFEGLGSWVDALTAKLENGMRTLLQWLGLLKKAGDTPLPGGEPIGQGGIGSNARGGMIGGRGTGTSDSNLAWLSRGEFVVRAAAVRKYGAGLFAALNAQRFAGGGLVGGGGTRTVNVSVDSMVQAIEANTEAIKSQSSVIMDLARIITDMAAAVSSALSASRSARGGLLGGRGTGTSDSNLAWVSRGEHIMPARAVAQPGVLAFLEALRRSGGNLSNVLDGMGRFALGGMVPRMPAFAAGGAVGGMSHVTIAFPGLAPISGLRASSAVVDELHRAAALAQVRSGGRKPSRYS